MTATGHDDSASGCQIRHRGLNHLDFLCPPVCNNPRRLPDLSAAPPDEVRSLPLGAEERFHLAQREIYEAALAVIAGSRISPA